MSNKITNLLMAILCLLPLSSLLSQQASATFSFTLPSTAVTSAGVYNTDSVLVRTLWSGVRYINGTHTEKWDGLLDNQDTALPGNYHVKVLSSNVQYNWDGARIGNTSADLTGSSLHRTNRAAYCVAIAGDSLFYGAGYHERFNTQFVVNLNNVEARARIIPADGGTNQSTYTNCTDGINVYWGGEIYRETVNNINYYTKFIFATRILDNSQVQFSSGSIVNAPKSSYSAISITPEPGTEISSMAVQKTGNFLFVARNGINQLQVINKTTGAFIRNISISNIYALAVDAQDNLWLSKASIVEKYTVNNDGTITSASTTLTGLGQPAAIAISPDNNTVVVADAALNQQVVKGFSRSTGGAAVWTLGIPGGYLTDATVSNNKFFFSGINQGYPVSIAFQSDGSFWVAEFANNRIQHYSAARVFLNRISYLGGALFVSVDPTNSSKLFAGLYEFNIDNTKPLDNGYNGSWALSKNWRAAIDGNVYDLGYTAILNPFTYSNRTFTVFRNFNGDYHVFELVSNGILRKTKQSFAEFTTINEAGKKIVNTNGYGTNTASQYQVYNLTGLDSDNDPVWASTPAESFTSPIATIADAVSPRFKLTADKLIYFQSVAVKNNSGIEYHLAAFKRNNSKWAFKTSIGTSGWYTGNFPEHGGFDNGNGVQVPHAGSYMTVNGTNIMWTYRGEFWKDIQANFFNHYHTSGLFVGQFGRDKSSNDTEANPPGAEGNAFEGSWVQVTPDKAFVFSGGEGVFSGIHRWSITGLSTVQTQTCIFNPSLNYTPPPPNLMAGLVHGQELTNGNGWTISHPSTPIVFFNTSWNVTAGRKTASKYGPQDVSIYYFNDGSGAAQVRTLTRSLGTNTGLDTWKVTGKISFDGGSPVGVRGGGCFFEILDQSGKIITRFNEAEAGRHSPNRYVKGNNVDLHAYSSLDEQQNVSKKTQQFTISNNKGTLTFQYATYAAITLQVAEAGADVMKPTTIRLRFTPGDYQKAMSVAELQFLKDTTNHYRTQGDGDWGNLNTWESSSDSITWNDATEIPNSVANSITIRNGDTVAITGAAAVDQLTIQNGAAINVAPKASLWINNGAGDDIRIQGTGKLTIQSDSSGTGRIGNSTGNINGNVAVENYIASAPKKAYHLLSSSVNTAGGPEPNIRDNWQEGQNNSSILANSNTVPRYGTHITGSLLGTNGFDATALATSSLFLYNQSGATPGFAGIANTNATGLEAKKGYLLFVRGDRSIDLATGLRSANTTLRATGTVLIGTQTFTGQEGNGRLSLVGNPYPSSINWNTISNDASTTNKTNFENYCTYWDPNIGENGGYVNISINGTKSNADNKETIIPAGQAFFIKAKPGVTAPMFTVKESHKSSPDDMTAFRSEAQAQFATSLYYTTLLGRRVQADAVNAVFDSTLSAGVDGNDAEEIANDNENIALGRGGKMLGIETRPLIDSKDTLFLRTQRLKVLLYEWQFQPVAIERPNLKAYLEDKFLNTRTEINCADSSITTIPFLVTVVPGSNAADRFRIVFTTNTSLPVTLLTLKAYQKNAGIEVAWSTGNEEQTQRYEVEKSSDARLFTTIGSTLPKAAGNPSNDYLLFDPNPKEGNNYYRIKTFHKNGTITYSGIVNVKTGGKKADFEVYPNPVSGKTITIQFNNVSRGVYSASLINAVGQKVFTRPFSHSGGSASQTVVLGDDLPLGTYYLQIVGNGISYNKKIIK